MNSASGECLNLLTHKAKTLPSPTVTISRKAEILACRSLIHSRKEEISVGKFRKKTVTNNIVSGSSGSGDAMLWGLRVRGLILQPWSPHGTEMEKNLMDGRILRHIVEC